MPGETRYATASGAQIAYRAIGDGPIPLLANVGLTSHVDAILSEPAARELFQRIGEFSRVLFFDSRGIGLSSGPGAALSLDQLVEDALAVLDAEGVERAAVFGIGVGSPLALKLAAAKPSRISHLILSSGFARMTQGEGYPYGNPPEVRAALIESVMPAWGEGRQVALAFPTLAADPDFREWAAKLEQAAASPETLRSFVELIGGVDLREELASIKQPTLVMHPPAALFFERGHSDYLAEQIQNATFLELPGADVAPFSPEAMELALAAIDALLTGHEVVHQIDRELRSLLFTDIVDSTQTAAKLGDAGWRELLQRHFALSRSAIEAFRGQLVKTTGDGIFASFDSPERAVQCARRIQTETARSALTVRAGIHVGECEVRDDDLAGMAVHIAARVAGNAAPDQLLVTRTVKDLIVGSQLTLTSQGEYELKGVPERWELFAVS